MIHLAIKTVRVVCAVILILIGIISGFIPILQGWIFIVAGLALLGYKPHHIKAKWDELKAWWRGSKVDPSEELD